MGVDEDVFSTITAGFGDVVSMRPPLLGRDVEIRKLQNVWERVSSSAGNSSEVVTVHGPSGVGKSYLIESFRSIVEGSDGTSQGIYVSSKFDQLAFKRTSQREPFYAVVSAFSDICEILQAKENSAEIGAKIRQAVGVEFSLLCQFIPTLHQLSESSQEETMQARESEETEEGFRWDTTVNKDDSLARICWAVRMLLNVAATCNPILLHFDDIHWADTESLSMIQALITDVESKSVLIALSYRDGVESSKVVSKVLDVRSTRSRVTFQVDQGSSEFTTTSISSGSVRMTEIRVSNLGKEGVRKLMSSLFWLERMESDIGRSKTLRDPNDPFGAHDNDLVNLVFLKTSGNPFFVLQFLERLKLDGLLHYSTENDRWEWSDMEAMTRLDVTEDVLGSIDARMSQLPAHVRKGLMIAAHLGFRFRRDVLGTVLIEEYTPNDESDDGQARIDHVLESAERASLLLRVDKGASFCFVHDRIQQCAYDMVAAGDPKRELYLTLGTRLLPMLEKDNSLYFLVADLLNNGSDMITDDEKRTRLVKINKTAAEMSIRRAAYSSATHYLRCAIDFLDFERMWDDLYDLTLSLHNGLALASCNCSKYDLCHRTAENIARNARCVEDKHMANLASVHAFTLAGRYDESVRDGLEALGELGVSIKTKPPKLFLLARLLRTRRSLMKKSRSYMLSLPKMVHPKKLAILELIGEINPSAFALSNEDLQLHMYELMMAYSLRHGWSASTMTATVAFGLVELAAFGNVKRAAELGSLALDMVSQYGKEESKCMSIMISYCFLFPWTRSWRECTNLLSNGFSTGLQHGKTYAALCCIANMVPALRLTEQLEDAERVMRSNYETMKRFKVSSSLLPLTNCYVQFVLNMLGYADNPLTLSGELMDEEDPLYVSMPIFESVMHLMQFELACHFRELDRACHLLVVLEQEVERFKIYCPNMVSFWFWSGMTYVDLARQKTSKRRRNLKRAKESLASLQSVVREGCEDARPFCQILEAEASTFSKSSKTKKEMYDLAIDAAAEHRFMGYAGVACERAYYYMESIGYQDGRVSQQYWNRMMGFYDQWGAIAKIDRLTRTAHGQKYLEQKQEEIPDVVVHQKSECSGEDPERNVKNQNGKQTRINRINK